jgi:hypothetical protein
LSVLRKTQPEKLETCSSSDEEEEEEEEEQPQRLTGAELALANIRKRKRGEPN